MSKYIYMLWKSPYKHQRKHASGAPSIGTDTSISPTWTSINRAAPAGSEIEGRIMAGNRATATDM